ncbi:MAG TPA: extracellular solute-binding protein [Actinomycetota bacterium]|nr:extracellular solute-binding protein [Actinomycetota bacterium]
MTEVVLRGITWNHDRGLGGFVATAGAWSERERDVRVEWTTRSLQAFADEPVEVLAERFDLLVIDHPSIGHAVATGSFVPLDDHVDSTFLDDQATHSVGASHRSYEWDGHQWALAVDAASQVAAYRPDLLERAGATPPRTWDDVFELAGEGVPIALPSIPVDAACAFFGVSGAPDGQPPSREGFLEALGLLRRILSVAHPESLAWNPPTVFERMATTDDVAYVPLAFCYSNYARPGYRSNVVRFAAPPGRGTLGGAGLAVSARSRHVDEAVRYATFVADGETQRTTYFEGGGQPGHRSSWSDASVNAASSGFFADTLGALDRAYLRPRHDGFLTYQERAADTIHGWLRGAGDDADTVVSELERAYRDSVPIDAETGASA